MDWTQRQHDDLDEQAFTFIEGTSTLYGDHSSDCMDTLYLDYEVFPGSLPPSAALQPHYQAELLQSFCPPEETDRTTQTESLIDLHLSLTNGCDYTGFAWHSQYASLHPRQIVTPGTGEVWSTERLHQSFTSHDTFLFSSQTAQVSDDLYADPGADMSILNNHSTAPILDRPTDFSATDMEPSRSLGTAFGSAIDALDSSPNTIEQCSSGPMHDVLASIIPQALWPQNFALDAPSNPLDIFPCVDLYSHGNTFISADLLLGNTNKPPTIEGTAEVSEKLLSSSQDFETSRETTVGMLSGSVLIANSPRDIPYYDALALSSMPSLLTTHNRKRARDPELLNIHEATGTQHGYKKAFRGGDELQICLYIDPVTERSRPKNRRTTRKVTGKVKRACFICRLKNRKVCSLVYQSSFLMQWLTQPAVL